MQSLEYGHVNIHKTAFMVDADGFKVVSTYILVAVSSKSFIIRSDMVMRAIFYSLLLISETKKS